MMKRLPPVSWVEVLKEMRLKPRVRFSSKMSCPAGTRCASFKGVSVAVAARAKGCVRATGKAEAADLRKLRRFTVVSLRARPGNFGKSNRYPRGLLLRGLR